MACNSTTYPNMQFTADSPGGPFYIQQRNVARYTLSIACLVLETVLPLLFVLIFARYRSRFPRTAVRLPVVPALSCLGCWVQTVIGPLTVIVGHENMPCFIHTFLGILVTPLFVASIVLLLINFTLNKRLARARLNAGARFLRSFKDEHAQAPTTTDDPLAFLVSGTVMSRPRVVLYGILSAASEDPRVSDLGKGVVTLRYLVSTKGAFDICFMLVFPSTIIALIIILAYDPIRTGCLGCIYTLTETVIICLFIGSGVVFGCFVAYRARGERDPHGLMFEAKILLVFALAALGAHLCSMKVLLATDSPFDFGVIMTLSLVGIVGMQTVVPLFQGWLEERRDRLAHVRAAVATGPNSRSPDVSPALTERKSPSKTPANSPTPDKRASTGSSAVMVAAAPQPFQLGPGSTASSSTATGGGGTSVNNEKSRAAAARGLTDRRGTTATTVSGSDGPLSLRQIMGDPELLQRFEDFLLDEQAVELLLFLQAVEEWKGMFYDVAENANAARAKRIFSTFLAEGAVFQTNVSARGVIDVAHKLEKTETVTYETFDEVALEVTVILSLGAVRRFAKRSRQMEADRRANSSWWRWFVTTVRRVRAGSSVHESSAAVGPPPPPTAMSSSNYARSMHGGHSQQHHHHSSQSHSHSHSQHGGGGGGGGGGSSPSVVYDT